MGALLALVITALTAVTPPAGGPRLTFLGETRIPFGTQFAGTTVGGLSAIDFDPRTGGYYVISDDRSQRNPARFYTAEIELARDRPPAVRLTGTHPWLRPDGTAFPPTGPSSVAPDPEGIAVDPRSGTLLWSSEGERAVTPGAPPVLADPWVRRSTTTGTYLGELPLPATLHVSAGETGPRQNQALEGLSFSPAGDELWSAMEDPLLQDGPDPTPTAGALTRLTRYDPRTGRPVAQYAYPVSPLFASGATTDTNGVSDIVALGGGKLLVLERASIFAENRWKSRIFLARTAGATDVLDRASLAGAAVRPMTTELLVDLSDVPGLSRIDNIEGLTLGPRLPDGSRALVLVSDDNFAERQVTQFVAFSLRMP